MPIPTIVVAAGDILEVRVNQTFDSQRLINVWHYITSSSGTATVPFDALADALAGDLLQTDGVADRMNQLQVPQCRQNNIEIQVIRPLRQAYKRYAGKGDGTAENPGTGLPPNVSLTWTMAPTQAKRGKHSTFKLGGLGTSTFDATSQITVGTQAAVDILASTMLEEITGPNGFTLSPGSPGKTLLSGFSQWAVTRTGRYAHVMRRRTVGLGI